MGLPLDDLGMEETLALVDEYIAARECRQQTVLNAAKVVLARKDPLLRESILASDVVQADGQSIVWASRVLGLPVRERVAGIDLMDRLLRHSVDRNYRVYFLGASEAVLRTALEKMERRYPGLRIAGARNGYFTPEEGFRVATAIRDARPDILFVAMPTPKKEIFIKSHLQAMQVPFCMGVGGSIDVVAGLVRRAPHWVQRIGMEWFYRMAQEPRRLWRRYAVTSSVFLLLLLVHLTSRKGSANTAKE